MNYLFSNFISKLYVLLQTPRAFRNGADPRGETVSGVGKRCDALPNRRLVDECGSSVEFAFFFFSNGSELPPEQVLSADGYEVPIVPIPYAVKVATNGLQVQAYFMFLLVHWTLSSHVGGVLSFHFRLLKQNFVHRFDSDLDLYWAMCRFRIRLTVRSCRRSPSRTSSPTISSLPPTRA